MRLANTAAMMLLVNLSFAQNTTPYTYNPDSNGDWMIGATDVLSILGIYGNPFNPTEIDADSMLILLPCTGLYLTDCPPCNDLDTTLAIVEPLDLNGSCLPPMQGELSVLWNLPQPPTMMIAKPDAHGKWHIPYGWKTVILVNHSQFQNPSVGAPNIVFDLYPGYNPSQLESFFQSSPYIPEWEDSWVNPLGAGEWNNYEGAFGSWNGRSIFGEVSPTPLGFPEMTTRIVLTEPTSFNEDIDIYRFSSSRSQWLQNPYEYAGEWDGDSRIFIATQSGSSNWTIIQH